jgi:hypothetical protein
MVAACANADHVAQFLLQQDAVDVEVRDRAGNTAGDLARKKGSKVCTL